MERPILFDVETFFNLINQWSIVKVSDFNLTNLSTYKQFEKRFILLKEHSLNLALNAELEISENLAPSLR